MPSGNKQRTRGPLPLWNEENKGDFVSNVSGQDVIELAEMLSAVVAFREAKAEAERLVRKAFPLRSEVRVKFESGNETSGIVHAYVADSPDQIAVMFENGNVWDKPVHRLTLVK
jgi:hypothetical protein